MQDITLVLSEIAIPKKYRNDYREELVLKDGRLLFTLSSEMWGWSDDPTISLENSQLEWLMKTYGAYLDDDRKFASLNCNK